MNFHAYDHTHRPRVRPATDILEQPDGILVRVNIPGVPPEDLTVEADHNELSIRGVSSCGGDGRRHPHGEEGKNILALEFVDVEYGVRIALSEILESEAIRATLHNGVLSVFLPRRQRRGPRSIPVETI